MQGFRCRLCHLFTCSVETERERVDGIRWRVKSVHLAPKTLEQRYTYTHAGRHAGTCSRSSPAAAAAAAAAATLIASAAVSRESREEERGSRVSRRHSLTLAGVSRVERESSVCVLSLQSACVSRRETRETRKTDFSLSSIHSLFLAFIVVGSLSAAAAAVAGGKEQEERTHTRILAGEKSGRRGGGMREE